MYNKTSDETLNDIKRYLDNGFLGLQIAEMLDVDRSIVSRVNTGKYGRLPTFKTDPELKKILCNLNRVKFKNRIQSWDIKNNLDG